MSHGVVNYPYNGRNYTACLFLVDEGYNIVAFQVMCFLKVFSPGLFLSVHRKLWAFLFALPLLVSIKVYEIDTENFVVLLV